MHLNGMVFIGIHSIRLSTLYITNRSSYPSPQRVKKDARGIIDYYLENFYFFLLAPSRDQHFRCSRNSSAYTKEVSVPTNGASRLPHLKLLYYAFLSDLINLSELRL